MNTLKTHLVFAAMATALFFFAISRLKKDNFTFDTVVSEARKAATQPYRRPISPLPQFLRALTYDQYRDIRFKESETLWRKQGLPFQVKFFQTGGGNEIPISVYEINRSSVKPVTYSPSSFDWGKNHFDKPVPNDAGYAGFRIHYPINRSDYLDEIAVFLGASYFRAVAEKQVYGLSARGLAIDTVARHTEEFPIFTKFWLREPERDSRTLQFYALLEGKSVTGAYAFEVTPGAETVIKVKATLFFRKKVEQLGMAPLTSMFWYGENTSNTFGDFRPEVHDSDGLLMNSGKGEWIWRPLSWGKEMQVNTFEDENPKGFGLIQRDRDFSHYQDLEAKYHMRPSTWVRPGSGWGKGHIFLLQLTANKEYADNVVAFWTPEKPPPPGGSMDLDYEISFYTENSALPPLGRCTSTRIDFQEAQYYRQMFLDFTGDKLNGLKPDSAVTADAGCGMPGVISEVKVRKNEFDNSWRATFVVSTKVRKLPIELHCLLLLKGEPITEKWTYTWTP